MREFMIGVDVGGTKVSAAITDLNFKILCREKYATDVTSSQTVIEVVQRAIHSLLGKIRAGEESVAGIGLGVAGTIDYASGAVVYSPNLPLSSILFTAEIQKEIPARVFIDNDANVATLGEKYFGAAKECANFIGLTLGTGVGGGIFIDGKLRRGATGSAGELGHMVIESGSAICACGNNG